MQEGELLNLSLKDDHVVATLKIQEKIFDAKTNRKMAVKMMRRVLEEIADEKVKRSRLWSTWSSPCSCGPRSPGNVNLTIFLCPCPLIDEILDYMYKNGRGARKAVQNQLHEHLVRKGYSLKEINEHLRGLHRRVGAIIPTRKGYIMTEFGIAIWRQWRRKFRLELQTGK